MAETPGTIFFEFDEDVVRKMRGEAIDQAMAGGRIVEFEDGLDPCTVGRVRFEVTECGYSAVEARKGHAKIETAETVELGSG